MAVTGTTAESKDFNDQMKSVAPLVFGFVLLFAFVLMLISFRSVVIAAKALWISDEDGDAISVTDGVVEIQLAPSNDPDLLTPTE